MRSVLFLVTVLTTFIIGCAPKPQTNDGPLITLLDFYRQGQQFAIKYLQDKVPVAESSVVRIQIIYNRTDKSFQTDHGTGCLVKGGFVATAGHCLDVLELHPNAEIRILFVDGKQIGATPYARQSNSKSDWALLRTKEPHEAGLDFGDRASNSTVVVMGYPGTIGFDRRWDAKYDKTDIAEPLRPALLICKTSKVTDKVVTPIAGAIPIGGMSGAPVIDSAGKLVGIQVAVTQDQTGKDTINIESVDELRAAAHKLEK